MSFLSLSFTQHDTVSVRLTFWVTKFYT